MGTTDKMYDYWLCSVEGIGNVTVRKLRKLFGSAGAVYEAGEEALGQVLKNAQLLALQESRRKWKLEEEYKRLQEKDIKLLLETEASYPQRLRDIPDAPYGLFYRGRLPEDGQPSAAVIGARDCSEYGRYVAAQLGKCMGERGIQVISGMARGIDGISQEAALKAGGISFGVLGNGVDVCYPAQNKQLYGQLPARGGLVSCYGPGTQPRPQNFPPRNRIVSGLADAVVVIEARERSGTLITVDMALEQGREVYVVPGRITDRLSDGCNRLLAQGASVFLSPENFARELEELFWERKHRRDGGNITEAKLQEKHEAGQDGGGTAADGKLREKHEAGQGGGGTAADGKLQEKRGQRALSQETVLFPLEQRLPDLPQELQTLYAELDYAPQSLSWIQARLHSRHGLFYSCPQLTAMLMRLCISGCAVQLTPGQFARKG